MDNKINPKHYRGIEIHGVEVQPADIIEAYFSDDGLLSQAAKYLLRHGGKEGNSYEDDVNKCLWWCARALLARNADIELPPLNNAKLYVNGQLVAEHRTKWEENDDGR